ncbi:MAG: YcxB family protein, partial [Clostridia bacterium]|nr:YcxB family protein [Clostridia bacterium]
MVEFKSKFDASKAKALNNLSLKRMKWLFIIASLLFITVGALGIAFREDEYDTVIGICFIVIGVMFSPLVIGLTYVSQRNINKSMSVLSDYTDEIYSFDEENITVTQQKGNVYFAQTKASYNYIYKILEDKNYYFLYISKMQCHVIDKASLTQGSLE